MNHPSIKMMYDSFHANIEEKNQEAAILSCKDETIHVHVSENDRGVPGTGGVELGLVLVGVPQERLRRLSDDRGVRPRPARPRRRDQGLARPLPRRDGPLPRRLRLHQEEHAGRLTGVADADLSASFGRRRSVDLSFLERGRGAGRRRPRPRDPSIDGRPGDLPMRVCNVVAARPNFMKMAPVVLELQRRGVDQFLVHTGQHYDANMSDVFFEELGMPRPDVHLGVGSGLARRADGRRARGVRDDLPGTQARPRRRRRRRQLDARRRARRREAPHPASRTSRPGSARSTARCPRRSTGSSPTTSATCSSSPRTTPSTNLRREGIAGDDRVHHVGNCMVDTLLPARRVGRRGNRPGTRFGLEPSGYALLTLHRPSNVDDDQALRGLIVGDQPGLGAPSRRLPRPPPDPRPADPARDWRRRRGSDLAEPLPYLAFLGMMARARCVLTDSGGIQEETTALGVPCLTLRENTERPITVSRGTNRLVGPDPSKIEQAVAEVLAGRWPSGVRPELWDGHAARRIVDVLTR